MTRLEKQVVHAKKLAIEEFRASDDFKEAVELTASTYFGKGFDQCKKKLNLLFPDLDINNL